MNQFPAKRQHIAPLTSCLACLILALLYAIGTSNAAAQDISNTDAQATSDSESQTNPRRRGRQGGTQDDAKEVPADATGDEADESDDAESTNDDADKEEDAPEYLAIIGGTVHTVSGPTMRGATVLCKDGVIERIGMNIDIPEHATIVDAEGQHVYPGLVACESTGIIGNGNPADSTNFYNLNLQLALSAGITTMFNGDTVAKSTYGTSEGMIVRQSPFQRINYSARNAVRKREFLNSLDEAVQFQRDVEDFQARKARDPNIEEKAPEEKELSRSARQVLGLVRGERVAYARAEGASDLLELAQLAEKYNFEIVIRGAREGWTVAEQLGQSNISVIATTRARTEDNRLSNRETGSSIENPAILHKHGVDVAVIPFGTPLFGGNGSGIQIWGLIGRDLLNLNMAAAFAVRGGMTNDEGIRTITLDAAKILGVDHRVGSIEVGKDADFVITSGDLLLFTTIVRSTIVNGHVLYEQEDAGIFSHVRTGEDGRNQLTREPWPRRLGEPW